mgnify:CR=1 FL=1
MMSTELQIVERAESVLGFASRKAALIDLAKRSANIVHITNPAGRQECHAALMVLKSERIDIQRAGKEAREEATKFSKAVIAKEKELIDVIDAEESRLQSLRDDWDEARRVEREALARKEAERIAAIRAKIDAIRSAPLKLLGKPSQEIAAAISAADEVDISEFAGLEQTEAQAAKQDAIDKLRLMWEQQVTQEEEQARLRAEREELERLRKEQADKLAEADRQATAARAEQDRQAKIERDQKDAEARRRLAEETKAREAEEARQRAEHQEAERQRLAKEAELERERKEFEAQKAKDAQERLEKELAQVTLLAAAQEAYQFMVCKGFANFPVAQKLKAALARETSKIAEAA